MAALGLPVFVKPARLGSSVGIVRVAAADELEAALEEAFRHDPRAIVEAAAPGLEVECSVLGHTTAAQASRAGEIVVLRSASPGGWYDYEAKYTPGGMELVVPARISAAATERVRSLAVAGVPPRRLQRAGARGLLRRRRGRVAQRAQHDAGLHADERLRQALGRLGHAVPDLCDRLVTIARERHARERRYRF